MKYFPHKEDIKAVGIILIAADKKAAWAHIRELTLRLVENVA